MTTRLWKMSFISGFGGGLVLCILIVLNFWPRGGRVTTWGFPMDMFFHINDSPMREVEGWKIFQPGYLMQPTAVFVNLAFVILATTISAFTIQLYIRKRRRFEIKNNEK